MYKRNGTCLTKPILLLPGTHYSLIRTTTLSVDKDSQSTKFLYLDGTGTNFGSRRPLKKANYYLTFWFSRPPVNDSEIADARTRLNLENFSIWSGEGATADVSFELLDPLPGS